MPSLFDLFVSISGDSSGYKKAMKDSQADTSDFEKAAVAATDKISDAFAGLGLKLTAAGIGAFVLGIGKELQEASSMISRETGAIGANLAGLEESFKKLYAGSAQSSEEVAGGLAKIAVETKLTGAELEALTEANLKFAKVASTDVRGAVDQTQLLFKNWGIATQDQSDALDVLYATMTAAGLSASDLSSQMTTLGPTARSFGLSFVQTAALVGAFHDAGLQASDMVRGLNTLFVKFAQEGKNPAEALTQLIDRLKNTATETAAVNELLDAGFAKRSAVAMADAARRGALDLNDFVQKLTESKGKIKEVADQSATFTGELQKLGHELLLSGGAIGEPLVRAFTDILKAIREANNEFATFESKAIDWLKSKTLTPGGVNVFGSSAAIASLLNPFSSLNPLNLLGNRPALSVPLAPKTIAPTLTVPNAATGAAPAGLSADDLKKDFGALGLEDLQRQLDDATKAFTELTAAHKLNDGQVILATRHIADLRGKIAELIAGYSETPKASNDLLKTLGISQVETGQIQELGNALTELSQHIQGFVGPQQNGIMDGKLSEAWQEYSHAVATADDEIKKGIDAVPWLKYANAVEVVDLSFKNHFSQNSLYVKSEADLNEELRQHNDILRGLPEAYNPLRAVMLDAFGNIKGVADAFHYFNLQTPIELAGTAEEAEKQFKIMQASGVAAPELIGEAWARMFKAQLALQLATGKITKEQYDDLVKQTDASFDKSSATAQKHVQSLGEDLQRATRSAFDDISRTLAQDLVEWKNWGDSIKQLGKTIAEDLMSVFLKAFLKPLEDKLAELAGKLGDWLGLGGGSGGGGVLGTSVGSAGGSGGSGGAAAAATSGLAGWVNVGVSALSGIVQGIEGAHTNTLLGDIRDHTLRIFNELFNFRQDAWTREGHLFAKLDDMWNEIRNVETVIKSMGGTGGNSGASSKSGFSVTISNCTIYGTTPQNIAQAIFDYASLSGAI
jgi:TP901 family phage tail tape measure protein